MAPERQTITNLDQKPGTVETRASQASEVVKGAKDLEILRVKLEQQALNEIKANIKSGIPITGTRIG